MALQSEEAKRKTAEGPNLIVIAKNSKVGLHPAWGCIWMLTWRKSWQLEKKTKSFRCRRRGFRPRARTALRVLTWGTSLVLHGYSLEKWCGKKVGNQAEIGFGGSWFLKSLTAHGNKTTSASKYLGILWISDLALVTPRLGHPLLSLPGLLRGVFKHRAYLPEVGTLKMRSWYSDVLDHLGGPASSF